MGKKCYERPVMAFERFVANEYCATCFTYQATLHCDYGKVYPATTGGPDGSGCYEGGLPITNNSPQHGAACANSYITVTVTNGVVTSVGHEGADKPDVPLESVYIPNIASLKKDDTFTGATWNSAGNAYHHKGDGIVTDWQMSLPGHPMHS